METFRISLEGYAGGARPGVPLSFSFWPEVPMTRERALKVVLVLVGLLFSAAAYPLLAMHLQEALRIDRKSTRLNSSHGYISYAVFCLKKKEPCGGRRPRTLPRHGGATPGPASGPSPGARDSGTFRRDPSQMHLSAGLHESAAPLAQALG